MGKGTPGSLDCFDMSFTGPHSATKHHFKHFILYFTIFPYINHFLLRRENGGSWPNALQPRLNGEARARTLQKEQTSEGFPYQAIALMCCDRVAVRQRIMGLKNIALQEVPSTSRRAQSIYNSP